MRDMKGGDSNDVAGGNYVGGDEDDEIEEIEEVSDPEEA